MMRLISCVFRQQRHWSERRDVIIVSSVSCIYGLGSPVDYKNMVLSLRPGMERDRDEVIHKLIDIQYDRNDMDFHRGTFRVRGDVLEIFPAESDEYCVSGWNFSEMRSTGSPRSMC